MDTNIGVTDNIFNAQDTKYITEYCTEGAEYRWGEHDEPQHPPTGLVHDIPEDEGMYDIFKNKIANDLYPEVKKLELYRMYVNCFAPREVPYWHTDGPSSCITFLYYPKPTHKWDLNELGETQFHIDDMIYGIPPIPNRMIMFNAAIKHRATSFRTYHRFTVAVKYKPFGNM